MIEKIKVFVVDDSMVFRKFLTERLAAYPEFEVVGYAMNAIDAKHQLERCHPDVMTLDIEMPGINGIDFLKELLPEKPIPVILVSSLNMNVFSALSCGAVDFVQKPDMGTGSGREKFISALARKIVTASKAKVFPKRNIPVKRPETGSRGENVNFAGSGSRGENVNFAGSGSRTECKVPVWQKGQGLLSMAGKNMVIAIGASTGGTEAVLEVLKDLPARMPGIVVTQHMPEGFTKMYAQRLNRLCRLEVKEAQNGDEIRSGRVLIAPGGMQMQVVRKSGHYAVSCFRGEKVSGHCPSVDVLFRSVAENVGKDAIGVIMTGMGRDGAEGLLKMRRAGAYTIGQDKDSCVVYGMPMVALNMGAVCRQASCGNIAEILMGRIQKI